MREEIDDLKSEREEKNAIILSLKKDIEALTKKTQ